MIRSVCLALFIAGPAGAGELCPAAWEKVRAVLSNLGTLQGEAQQDGDWCKVDGLVMDLDGQYLPDWHVDQLRVRGSALGWLVDGSQAPDGLEIVVDGLRLVPQTGDPQMDWLFQAQSRPNAIRAEAALSWDVAEKVLRLEGLTVDFPGENLVELSVVARGVDLSSTGALQMSATGFAVTEADLRVTTHGLFEWYVLMPFGPTILPQDGDMEIAADALRMRLRAAVADLPGASVSTQSKAALADLIDELPNPSGDLSVSFRSNGGIGPARFIGWAMTGVPRAASDASAVLEGATVEVDWTHEDAS
ncbi:MAG TPA: hypothetical protein VK146_04545 [Tabrizicola sp.]|nr:hypothetical protein [Tabrizicola sp.]